MIALKHEKHVTIKENWEMWSIYFGAGRGSQSFLHIFPWEVESIQRLQHILPLKSFCSIINVVNSWHTVLPKSLKIFNCMATYKGTIFLTLEFFFSLWKKSKTYIGEKELTLGKEQTRIVRKVVLLIKASNAGSLL